MSNEVKLKARIQNKYDTLENWNKLIKGDFIPLKGEVCYAIDNNKLYQKVGDGKTDFLDLSWLLNQGDWNEENEFSPEYIKNKPMKIITEPTHIADLDVGTYLVNGNILDFDNELGQVIIQNVTPDGKINDRYFILFNGIISITQKYIVNEDDTEERIAISFTASGNMSTPDGINITETTDKDGNIIMKETIATTSFSSSVSYIIAEYVKPKVNNPDKGYVAGQWYNEDLFSSIGDVSCEALTEEITSESTRFKVPTAKAVYEFGQTLQAGGGSSVQSDYLQNDPAAKDYIKNRPFYSEITYDRAIVPLQEVQFVSDNTPEGLLMGQIVIEENKAAIANNGQYNLIIDGVTHLITATSRPDLGEEEYFFYFGNLGMISSDFTNSGEDYLGVIACIEHELILLLYLKTTETTHEVGLSYVGDTVPLIVEDEYDFVEVKEDITFYIKEFPYGLYSMGLQENDVLNVTFNGKSYTNLTWKFSDEFPFYLGNTSILGFGDDTGEDWLFTISGESDVGFITLEAGPHTLSLEKASLPFTEIVHKIDSKYLDVNVEVPYTEDSSGNVTFKGDVKTSNRTSLNTVNSRLNTTNNTLSTVQNSLNTVKDDLNTVKNDLNTTKNDLNTVKTDLNTTKNDLNTVKTDLNTTKNDLNTVKNDLEANKPVQSDFTQKDSTAKDYIKNKPRIGQDYIILTDIENNANYIIQMVNGSLASCKIPTSIEVTTNPIKMEYFRGEVFDPTGMVLTAYYGDGTSEIIENYTYFTGELENCGNIDFTITTQIKSVTYKNTVPILVFHLDDFEYTTNEDGTYTITAWKGTLNGEPSTEMIIPDSSHIKI